jgi:hypothetical protein
MFCKYREKIRHNQVSGEKKRAQRPPAGPFKIILRSPYLRETNGSDVDVIDFPLQHLF